jgi:hypothetical protein
MKHCFGSSSPNFTLRDVHLVLSIVNFLSSQSCIFCVTIKVTLLCKESFGGYSETGFFMTQFCQFLGALAKLRKAAITFTVSVSLSFRPSVRPLAWHKLAPTEWIFLWYLISEQFSKICLENSSCIKIQQE